MVKKIFFVLVWLMTGTLMGSPIPWHETALAQTADPVFVGAGDIAHCNRTQDEATAQLLDNIDGTVFTLGDNAYPDGTTDQFNNCYDPTWGRHKGRTYPSVGNHEYFTAGAAGYYTYFGAAASPLDPNCTSNCKGYYSYNLGEWHIIVLNSEIDRSAGSAQEQWLRADLATNQSVCTLAYWHKPRFSSGVGGNNTSLHPFWQALYEYGADVVLSGHAHFYERFGPQDPSGQADPTRGIREFIVGTGGVGLLSFGTVQPNSEVRNNTTWGVLKMTLHPTTYEWEFVPIAGQTFTDSGSASCVSSLQNPPVANDDNASTLMDIPVTIDVAANDSDPDGNLDLASTSATCSTCLGPANGNLANNGNGTFEYTPNPGFQGSDGFVYQICDMTGLCDIASVAITVTVNSSTGNFRLSLVGNGTVGSVTARDEDILEFNATSFAMLFDGSDVGAGGVDLDAFYVANANTILMSFDNPVTLGTLGTVDDSDIVQFNATSLGADTAGSFSMYFDGSDVGLDTNGEDIDAIELLTDGKLLISTRGGVSVSGVKGLDEDLLAFTATSLGDNTSGAWAMHFDGSDVDLSTTSDEDVDGVSIAANGDVYLTTVGNFSVNGLTGADEDIFICTPISLGTATACNYSPALFFDGSAWGLEANDLDAFDLP